MLSDQKRQLLRTLTQAVVEAFIPHKLVSFEEEFTPFALAAGTPQVQERLGFLKGRDQGLDTTLVAGMFFQVLVEAEHSERVYYVRKQAKSYLVNRLAGQISLSQFFRLLNLIDENVQRYFYHLRSSWTNAPKEGWPQASPSLTSDIIEVETLRQDLAHFPMESTRRRKLTQEKLLEFLQNTDGSWFKLLDFETYFQVHKKTAWTCLNQLLEDGILLHNGEKANKVRYTLASRFRTGEPTS